MIPSFPDLSGSDADRGAVSVVTAEDAAARLSAAERMSLREEENNGEEDTPRVMMSGDELTSQDESDGESDDSDTDDAPSAKRQKLTCVCCDLATSAVVRAMDSVAGA